MRPQHIDADQYTFARFPLDKFPPGRLYSAEFLRAQPDMVEPIQTKCRSHCSLIFKTGTKI